jgi:glycosyltransferase involved in cell wall biosynthesis
MPGTSETIDVIGVLLDKGLSVENSAVFQAQFAGQFKVLSKLGYQTAILITVNDRTQFFKVAGASLEAAGVEIMTISERGFLRNFLSMILYLRKLRRQRDIRKAYVRGLWGALVLLFAHPFSAIPYVYDVRGDVEDETMAASGSWIKRKIYRVLSKLGLNGASHVTAVSTKLASQLELDFRVSSVLTIPSCVDVSSFTAARQRTVRRCELGVDDNEVLLVYSGGLSYYQQVPAMISIWRALLDIPKTRFLLLTNEDPHSRPDIVGDLMDFGGRLTHRSIPREDVPGMLSAADIGFLLRDDRRLNQVASPVKFAEYLAAGLSVVSSPLLGDVAATINDQGLGILIEPTNSDENLWQIQKLIDALAEDRATFRQRALLAAEKKFDWKAYAPTFAQIYNKPSEN